VYARAAETSRQAAEEIRAGRRGAADTARAAADLLTVAAEVTGNPELRKAADYMSRAARAQWRRIPAGSDSGRMLRAAARALATSRRYGVPPSYAFLALLLALVALVQALAELRVTQNRLLQAAAARDAAARLTAVAAAVPDTIADAFTVLLVHPQTSLGHSARQERRKQPKRPLPRAHVTHGAASHLDFRPQRANGLQHFTDHPFESRTERQSPQPSIAPFVAKISLLQ
jgi:hypothetical protein